MAEPSRRDPVQDTPAGEGDELTQLRKLADLCIADGDAVERRHLQYLGEMEDAITSRANVARRALAAASSLPVQEEARERQLVEFDAWLSFRGEFREVLLAFRQAFGTDTSAAPVQDGETKEQASARMVAEAERLGHDEQGDLDDEEATEGGQ